MAQEGRIRLAGIRGRARNASPENDDVAHRERSGHRQRPAISRSQQEAAGAGHNVEAGGGGQQQPQGRAPIEDVRRRPEQLCPRQRDLRRCHGDIVAGGFY